MADEWPGGWKEGRKRNEEEEEERRRRHQPPLTQQRGNWMERRGVGYYAVKKRTYWWDIFRGDSPSLLIMI